MSHLPAPRTSADLVHRFKATITSIQQHPVGQWLGRNAIPLCGLAVGLVGLSVTLTGLIISILVNWPVLLSLFGI